MKTRFDITKKDQTLLDIILEMIRAVSPKTNIFDIEMDLIACHLNGNRLDFEKLMWFDEFDFFHDLLGIQRHMDRNTGKLKNCFSPRSSWREHHLNR